MRALSLPRLILYARTATDDNKSPEDSKRWQVSLGTSLVAGRATITAVVHDTDVSPTLSWDRRPQAARLLAEMADPNRGWDGIVIGEPQRAFGKAVQYQTVTAAMEYHGVSLWVPEVGGPVDFTSEAHDIVLNIFGTMSKGERTRLKKRVRAGMTAMAGTARFLGGRPPFGYRLVSTGVPQSNPDKRWAPSVAMRIRHGAPTITGPPCARASATSPACSTSPPTMRRTGSINCSGSNSRTPAPAPDQVDSLG